jgi:undecaprenyl-diphosphatase
MPSRTEPGHSARSLKQAAVLGALHAPAELLPISSSAHVTLLPWLLGWDYTQADAQLRKRFEVAVHAGAAAGMLVADRSSLSAALKGGRLGVMAIAAAPPALAGYLLRGKIAAGLGTAATIAPGLLVGSIAMGVADRAAQQRSAAEAGPIDAVCLGLAQALALAPGVSRSGATLAAARLRRFTPAAAEVLSHQVGLPVIAGAAGLELVQLQRDGLGSGWAGWLACGAVSAFASALIASRWMRPAGPRRLTGWAVYRVALATLIVARKGKSGRAP